MTELITAALAAPNLFLTILLGLVTFYWLSVIVGAIGMDTFDIDIDVDVDVDVDVDIDVDADIDTDIHGNAAETAHLGDGFMIGILRFFNFGRVPFMVLLSTIILCMWSISVYCNHDGSWINPNNSTLLAALFFVPNGIASLLASKFLTAPLVPIFAKLNTSEKALVIDGKVGTLIVGIKDEETGQVKININGSIVSLSVTSNQGKEIKKGEKVVIVEKKEDSKIYIVQRIEHH